MMGVPGAIGSMILGHDGWQVTKGVTSVLVKMADDAANKGIEDATQSDALTDMVGQINDKVSQAKSLNEDVDLQTEQVQEAVDSVENSQAANDMQMGD